MGPLRSSNGGALVALARERHCSDCASSAFERHFATISDGCGQCDQAHNRSIRPLAAKYWLAAISGREELARQVASSALGSGQSSTRNAQCAAVAGRGCYKARVRQTRARLLIDRAGRKHNRTCDERAPAGSRQRGGALRRGVSSWRRLRLRRSCLELWLVFWLRRPRQATGAS